MKAKLIIEQAFTRRTTEQVAAWYTEVELQPGEYEIVAPGPLDYFRVARVPGVVVDENFPPMFGGIAYSASRKDNVGKETTYHYHVPDRVEEHPEKVKSFNDSLKGLARIEVEATYDEVMDVLLDMDEYRQKVTTDPAARESTIRWAEARVEALEAWVKRLEQSAYVS